MPTAKSEAQTKKPQRKNKPSYIVSRVQLFAAAEADDGVLEGEEPKVIEAWVPLLGHDSSGKPRAVQAQSRKDAIVKATALVSDAEKEGLFMVVPEDQVVTIRRKTKQMVIDEFE